MEDLAAINGESDLGVISSRFAEDRNMLQKLASKEDGAASRNDAADGRANEQRYSMTGSSSHVALHGASVDHSGETKPVGGLVGGSWELYLPRLVADAQEALHSSCRCESDVHFELDCATPEPLTDASEDADLGPWHHFSSDALGSVRDGWCS